jgi:hypothetical protein
MDNVLSRIGLIGRNSDPDNPVIATLTTPFTPKCQPGCRCCAYPSRLAEFGIGQPPDITPVITHDVILVIMGVEAYTASYELWKENLGTVRVTSSPVSHS